MLKQLKKKVKSCPISLFLHNNPKEMKGSKSISERKELILNCAAIYCVSEYIRNEFIDGLNINCQKVFVLYNGVERQLTEFPKRKKEVLFVGRIVPEKGLIYM